MQFRPETRRPTQDYVIRADELSAIRRIRIIRRLGRNRETPDIPFPRTVWIGFVDFVDSPVVRCSRDEALRIGKSRKAGHVKCCRLVTSECLTCIRCMIHIVKVVAQIHIVRNGKISRRPAQVHPRIFMNGAIRRDRITGAHARRIG